MSKLINQAKVWINLCSHFETNEKHYCEQCIYYKRTDLLSILQKPHSFRVSAFTKDAMHVRFLFLIIYINYNTKHVKALHIPMRYFEN